MKRWIAAFMIAALLFAAVLPVACAEEEKMSFVLTATDASAAGDLVTISGRVYHAPPCASFRVIFTYDDTVLEVQEGQKGEVKGLFMLNTKTQFNGKAAVNALSADVNEVLSGDMLLFRVFFKVKEVPADGKALIQVVQTEFISSDEALTKLDPIVNGCVVKIGEPQGGTPAKPDPIEETPKPDESPAPDDTTPAPDETDSKEPTGIWLIDPNAKTATHAEPETGETVQYTVEIKETEGTTLLAELTDENGKPAGVLELEERPNGTLDVVSQDLVKKEEPKEHKFPTVWIIACAAVLLAAAALIAILTVLKKKKGSAA